MTMAKKTHQIKYKKAPQAPRRFKSSYMFFSTEKHKSIRKELMEKGDNEKVGDDDDASIPDDAFPN